MASCLGSSSSKYDFVCSRQSQINSLDWIATQDLDLKPANIRTMTNVSPIGKGEFGSVFLVMHIGTEKYCAVKFISKEFVYEKGLIEKLQREINIAAKLKHTFLAQFFCAYETPGCIGLAFELAYGGSLVDRLSNKGSISENEAKFYFCELASALQYLHESVRVIHRDIRTDNILLDSTGHIKLCDFGMAVSFDETDDECMSSESNQLLALAIQGGEELTAYMAPELVQQEAIYPGCESKMDYFSLGLVLLEMLTGEIPSTKYNVTKAEPRLPIFMKKQLKSLIRGMLLKDPRERFGFENVTTSVWLIEMNWDKINDRRVFPPWRPVASQQPGTKYFNLPSSVTVDSIIDPLQPVMVAADAYIKKLKIPSMRANPIIEKARLERKEKSFKVIEDQMQSSYEDKYDTGIDKPKSAKLRSAKSNSKLVPADFYEHKESSNLNDNIGGIIQLHNVAGKKYSSSWNKSSSTVVPTTKNSKMNLENDNNNDDDDDDDDDNDNMAMMNTNANKHVTNADRAQLSNGRRRYASNTKGLSNTSNNRSNRTANNNKLDNYSISSNGSINRDSRSNSIISSNSDNSNSNNSNNHMNSSYSLLQPTALETLKGEDDDDSEGSDSNEGGSTPSFKKTFKTKQISISNMSNNNNGSDVLIQKYKKQSSSSAIMSNNNSFGVTNKNPSSQSHNDIPGVLKNAQSSPNITGMTRQRTRSVKFGQDIDLVAQGPVTPPASSASVTKQQQQLNSSSSINSNFFQETSMSSFSSFTGSKKKTEHRKISTKL